MQRNKMLNLILIGSMLSAMLGITPAWAVPRQEALAQACLTPTTLQRLHLVAVIDNRGWHDDSHKVAFGQHITVTLKNNDAYYDTIHVYNMRRPGEQCYPTSTRLRGQYGGNYMQRGTFYFYTTETP